MRTFGAALVLSTLLVVAGCGSSDPKTAATPSPSASVDPNRPSADVISQAMRADDGKGGAQGTFTKDAADCIGRTLYASAMSTAGIKKFLKGGQTFSTSDTDAFRTILPALAACNPITPPAK